MSQDSGILEKFFSVIAKGQTYLNFIYLFLAFPLGLIYFIFLVTGISVGVATLIIWIGLFILAMVIAGWWLCAGFERVMAINLLHFDIAPMSTPRSEKAQTNLQKLGAFLTNPVTWKSLLYLFVKFPLGILSFVVLVTLTSITLVMLFAPLLYRYIQPEIIGWTGVIWRIDTMGEAVAASVIGFILIFVSLHIFNGLAWVSGKFAQIMLGNPLPAAVVSPAPVPPVENVNSVPSVEGAEKNQASEVLAESPQVISEPVVRPEENPE